MYSHSTYTNLYAKRSLQSSQLVSDPAAPNRSPLDSTRSRHRAAATSAGDRGRTRAKRRKSASPADWTVMVYMAGNNLEDFGIQDFLEMAKVGSNHRVNVVVQFDRTPGVDASFGDWTDTRRGLIHAGDKPNAFWGNSIGEVNMGNANTLKNFVDWGTNSYKAKHYALVMWGHGDGLNVSYDDITDDGISGNELSSVLSSTGNKVELVGADACLMATTEFAYQISNNAAAFVGSQELEPGTGWNYTNTLRNLEANPTQTPAQFGSTIATSYQQTYAASDETFSMVNLAALRSSNPASLTNALNTFASTARNASTRDLNVLDQVRDSLAGSFGKDDQGVADPAAADFCDVGKLFTRLVGSLDVSSTLQTAAQSVLTAYSSTIIQNYSAIPSRTTGLSIYFSDRGTSPMPDYTSGSDSFLVNTQWDEFLDGWLWY
jgi:Clostripain family